MLEKKAQKAWDILKYHYRVGDVPAMDSTPNGFSWPPSIEQARLVYRTIAARVHPDRGGPAEVFRDVTEARLTLVEYLEKAQPAQPSPQQKTGSCEACGGRGSIRSPSRTLGGKGLRKRCVRCGGSGVTC